MKKKKAESMNSDMQLEREFGKFVNLHKFAIISSTLAAFEDEGIYDTFLFKDKYDDVIGEGREKARNVAEILLNNSFNSKEENDLFNDCYNYCYDRFKEELRDDFNATRKLMNN